MSDNDRIKPVFLPAGVAGPEKRSGYIADMPRGIEALDLSNAQLVWVNAVVARPVIVAYKLLAALRATPDQTNTLQLIVLDRNDGGKLLLESKPLVFPDSIFPSISMSDSFHYEVSVRGQNLLLEWEGQARYRGGAPPPTHIQAQAAGMHNGIARVNLHTGETEMLPSEKKSNRELPAALQGATVFSYQMDGADSWITEPWSVGDELAVIIGEISEEQQVLQLQKWNPRTGELHTPQPLVNGEALVSYVTPDGRYLLIHSEVHAQASSDATVPWWLFSVETGKLMARLRYEEGTKEACVLDSCVYYIVDDLPPGLRTGRAILQPTMKAVDITTTGLIWQHPLSPKPTTTRPPLRQ